MPSADVARGTLMIIRAIRRLFNGYYVQRIRHGAQRAAWRIHTDSLNAHIEKRREIASEEKGSERKVKTR
jgi:hypothetical protein